MAKKPVVVIGMGEMGSVFARGLLRLGHPVFPINRDTNMRKLARELPDPRLVLVAVGEKDLIPVLEKLPRVWLKRLALLQNELLPKDYEHLGKVSVISVWFEKKRGQDSKVIMPSPAYGPRAKLLRLQFERTVALLERHREQGREKRCHRRHVDPCLAEDALELVALVDETDAYLLHTNHILDPDLSAASPAQSPDLQVKILRVLEKKEEVK